jgi:hypothetical protein
LVFTSSTTMQAKEAALDMSSSTRQGEAHMLDRVDKLYSTQPLRFDDDALDCAGLTTDNEEGEEVGEVDIVVVVRPVPINGTGVLTQQSLQPCDDVPVDGAVFIGTDGRSGGSDLSTLSVSAPIGHLSNQPSKDSTSEIKPRVDVSGAAEANPEWYHLQTSRLAAAERLASSSLENMMDSLLEEISVIDTESNDLGSIESWSSDMVFNAQLQSASLKDSDSFLGEHQEVIEAGTGAGDISSMSQLNHGGLGPDIRTEEEAAAMSGDDDTQARTFFSNVVQPQRSGDEKLSHRHSAGQFEAVPPLVSQSEDGVETTRCWRNTTPVPSSTVPRHVTTSNANKQAFGNDVGDGSDDTGDKADPDGYIQGGEDAAGQVANDRRRHMSNTRTMRPVNPAFPCQHDGDPDMANDSGQATHQCTDGQLAEGRTPATPTAQLHIQHQKPHHGPLETLPDSVTAEAQQHKKTSASGDQARPSEPAARAKVDDDISNTKTGHLDESSVRSENSGKARNKEEPGFGEQPTQKATVTSSHTSSDDKAAAANHEYELSFSSTAKGETHPPSRKQADASLAAPSEVEDFHRPDPTLPRQSAASPAEKSIRLPTSPSPPEKMVPEVVSKQPKAAPNSGKSRDIATSPQQGAYVSSDLLDDGVTQTVLYGTLAVMAAMVYKAGTA